MRRPYALLALTLAGTACAGEPGRVRPPTTVVISEPTEVGTLLPILEQTALDGEINDHLYLSLNSSRWEDGEIVYVLDALALAEAWQFGPDSASLTYRLRPNAVWSDGTRLTAEDVVFSYELARDTLVASTHSDAWKNLDSIVAGDPRTVTFYFRRRNPDMLFDSGRLGILPKHIYGPADRRALRSHPRIVDPANGNLVVSGPYTVGSWTRGSELTLVPNPRGFTAQPHIDRIVFRVIPEESTRLLELANGSVHVTAPIPFERAREIEDLPRVRLEHVRLRFYDYVAWNGTRVPAFSDPDVRRALSLAIDRAAILEGFGMTGFAVAAAGPYPPILRAVHDSTRPPDRYRPDSARAILRRKGWTDADGDGILEKGGRPFRFTLTTNAGNARREAVAQMIQAQMKRIGVEVRVRRLETNTFFDGLFRRQHEAALAGWQVGLNFDLSVFFVPTGPLNVTGYADAKVQALIDSALAQPTVEAAARYWQAAARAVAADQPYAFLYFYDGLVAVDERLQDVRIDSYGTYQNLHEWRWVSDAPLAADDRAP